MDRSEQINELAAALAKASAEFGAATKDATNPAFRSTYADLASVLAAVRPALSKHSITIIQSAVTDMDGKTVTVQTMLVHASGQFVSSALTMPVPKWDPQGIGSAITYGRRYMAMAMCGIAPEDDDGEGAGKGETVKEHRNPPKPAPQSDAQIERIRAEIMDAASYGENALQAVGRRISQMSDHIKKGTRQDFAAALVIAKQADAERLADQAGTHMDGQ